MNRREGFWKEGPESLLPMPHARDKAWKGQKRFLDALRSKQGDDNTQSVAYKGASQCRLCKCRNGSMSFIADGWTWPEGLAHYVSEHNVRPSLAFQEFILGEIIK